MLQISAIGDTGLRIQFGKSINVETNKLIRSLSFYLDKKSIKGVIEWIPTYTAITIVYNPYMISYNKLKIIIQDIQKNLLQFDVPMAKIMQIPICYGDEYGPDLSEVANYNRISIEEVISIHSSRDYLIYMIGFTPGFPYLGGMSRDISTPRLAEPRTEIPTGSIGIAENQTGIYPVASPGGWQLIGRTPLKIYDPISATPILLKAGNYIRFKPISSKEYDRIESEVENESYKISVTDFDCGR